MSNHPRHRDNPRGPTPNSSETIKETLESLVMAFVLAFAFRAYVVEAFVIPTGSMAPTLLGQHLRVQCLQCGYRIQVDVPEHSVKNRTAYGLSYAEDVVCPMCHYPNYLKAGTQPRSGDRILVHKYIYNMDTPRRWDVVVFKNPKNPLDNFIKRLVGLPDELLLIVEGNVYVKPRGSDASNWQIARKTDEETNPHAFQIQRAVWQPIYHSQYVPLDGGRAEAGRRAGFEWVQPWQWQPLEGGWRIHGRRYQHDSADSGSIAFDFRRQTASIFNRYSYNQFRSGSLRRAGIVTSSRNTPGEVIQPVEDVRIAAAFKPDRDGLSLSIRTTARLDQQVLDARPIELVASIDGEGNATLKAPIMEAGSKRTDPILARKTIDPIRRGRSTQVELWYVDQEASLWVDGRRILLWQFEIDMDILKRRLPLNPRSYPEISIIVSGSPVTLHRLEVDRDISYTSINPNGSHHQGTFVKMGPDQGGDPIDILPSQFFCLGDNSPLSHDGRFWRYPHPHLDKLNLLPTNKAHRYGVVPEQLMIGRAFFVYFPAPYPVGGKGPAVIPNFADMRFIH